MTSEAVALLASLPVSNSSTQQSQSLSLVSACVAQASQVRFILFHLPLFFLSISYWLKLRFLPPLPQLQPRLLVGWCNPH